MRKMLYNAFMIWCAMKTFWRNHTAARNVDRCPNCSSPVTLLCHFWMFTILKNVRTTLFKEAAYTPSSYDRVPDMIQIWQIRFPDKCLLALCYIYQDKFFAFSQPWSLAFFISGSTYSNLWWTCEANPLPVFSWARMKSIKLSYTEAIQSVTSTY
jgi:hypothetical protein